MKAAVCCLLVSISLLVGQTNMQACIDSLQNEIKRTPDDYLLYFKLGSCYYALEKFDLALQAFNHTIELNKEYKAAELKIAIVYYAMDSFVTAKNKLLELEGRHKDKIAVLYWLGIVNGALGSYDEMLAAFKEISYDTLKRDSAYLHCAFACTFLGKFDEAINYNKKVLKEVPWWDECQLITAMIYKRIGDTLSADKYFSDALKNLTDYYRALYHYDNYISGKHLKQAKARYYYRFGDYDNAVGILDDLIKDDTTIDYRVYNKGIFRIADGDTRGLDDIRKASLDDTVGCEIMTINTLDALRSDSIIKALYYLEENSNILRKSILNIGLLAWCLEQVGRDAEARKFWFKCYGRLPLGIDVLSMRNFINQFVQTVKSYE